MGDLQLKTGPALRVVREFARSIFATICAVNGMSIDIFWYSSCAGNWRFSDRVLNVTEVSTSEALLGLRGKFSDQQIPVFVRVSEGLHPDALILAMSAQVVGIVRYRGNGVDRNACAP